MTQQEFFEKVWEKAANDLSQVSIWQRQGGFDIRPFARSLKLSGWRGKALDIGCGRGRQTTALAESGFEAHGIDFSETAIRLATKDARKSSVAQNIHFTVGNVLSLPYADGQFSVVIDSGCLHHIEQRDWKTYAAELGRVTRPGGIFRVFAWNRKSNTYKRHEGKRDPSGWVGDSPMGGTYFFGTDELESIFAPTFTTSSLTERHGDNGNVFIVGIFLKRSLS